MVNVPKSLHVIPMNDAIEHEASEDCICGPECQPIQREDGSYGWLYRHHSLDSREMKEPDYDDD